MTSRRKFLAAGAAAVPGALSAPAVLAQAPIRWRLQTYAGGALAEHVIKPQIEQFNQIAAGQMEIERVAFDLKPASGGYEITSVRPP